MDEAAQRLSGLAAQERQKAMLCAIGELLRYPTALRASVVSTTETRSELIAAFLAETHHVDLAGMEELYTNTFDLNPVVTLEVGFHLWGEQYERGRFLSDLRELQTRLGIDSGSELPDHLTVLLPTIAAAPEEHAAQLSGYCAKALEKMLAPLDEHGNPYRHLLRAALECIGEVTAAPPDQIPRSARDDKGGDDMSVGAA